MMRAFLALTCLLAATPALAQQQSAPAVAPVPAGPGQPPATIIAEPVALMIAGFDADGDARVTRAEFDTGVKRSFDSADRGHTGAIGYIAFSDWSERWLGNRNALPSPFETDRNGDNKITLGEMQDRFDLFFTRFDANKDGVIDRSELLTVRTPPMERPAGKRGKHGGPPPRQ